MMLDDGTGHRRGSTGGLGCMGSPSVGSRSGASRTSSGGDDKCVIS